MAIPSGSGSEILTRGYFTVTDTTDTKILDGAAANCHIGQYSTAVMGTLNAVQMTWLELAAASDPDINLISADEATLAENTNISAASNAVTLINGGDGTANNNVKLSARTLATANQYLYLTTGDATENAYTAGRLLIEFYGVTV